MSLSRPVILLTLLFGCGGNTTGGEVNPDLEGGTATLPQGGTRPVSSGGTESALNQGGGVAGGSEGGASTTGGGPGSGGTGQGGAGTGGTPVVCEPDTTPAADLGSASCPDFSPSGGELVGSWRLTAVCADPPIGSFSILCGEGTDQTTLTGELTFGRDGSYTATATVHAVGHVSASCLASWDRVCGENPFEGCVPASDGGCDCDYTGEPSSNSGWTYVVSGSAVILIDATCTPHTGYFSVVDSQLWLRSTTESGQTWVYQAERS